VIDLTRRMPAAAWERLASHRKVVYCSYHTTAGYLEQSLCLRFRHRSDLLDSLFGLFQQMFPPGADYEHDKLHLRGELSEEQRRTEPRNADSHLAFIGAGLRNCVTYHNRPATPVYFIDLDGVHEHGARRRRTTALGYDHERPVYYEKLPVPVSSHPVDSVNLRDEQLGLFQRIEEIVRCCGVDRGRVDLSLARTERNAGLTVNEYETLLMQHDLREVLANPMRFMAERGRSLWRDPLAIPGKTLNYAKYDLVNALNELMDAAGVSESVVERVLARFLAVPAERFLRMKRAISLLVCESTPENGAGIARGAYQTPILVQWQKASGGTRYLDLNVVQFA